MEYLSRQLEIPKMEYPKGTLKIKGYHTHLPTKFQLFIAFQMLVSSSYVLACTKLVKNFSNLGRIHRKRSADPPPSG